MTNAELIAKIKAEIEILRAGTSEFNYQNAVGYNWALDDVLSFLSTLESEKPMNQEGLEEEIHKYNKERFDEYFPEQDGDFISEVDFMTCLDRVARYFARWDAEHLAGVRKMIEPEKKEGRTYCSSQGEVPNDNLATQSYENISNDLKEASEKEYPCDKSWMTEIMLDLNAHCQVAFWKGAKWQKEQDDKELSEKVSAAYQLGLSDREEQMMKEAVEGFIFQSTDYYPKQLIAGYDGELGMGDKVRIIIVKEDGK